MAEITIIHDVKNMMLSAKAMEILPYYLYIDRIPVGVLRGGDVSGYVSVGEHLLSIRLVLSLFRWNMAFSAHKTINVPPEGTVIVFGSRERLWNILFDIDLVIWIAGFFVTMASPWNTIYNVLSNGFFIIWILHLWGIRNRFFNIRTKKRPENGNT